jgi:uracil-DNA glycosylase
MASDRRQTLGAVTHLRDLAQLCAQAKRCRICRDAPFGGPAMLPQPRPLFQASVSARLCIAGQAPGTRACASMQAFNDASGDRLRAWMGMTRDEFYDAGRVAILPMGFCFPGTASHGGDLPPRKECAPTWRTRFLALMPAIELIVCIGSYAQSWHLGDTYKRSMDATVRDWHHILNLKDGPRIFPLPHPSWRNNTWLNRNPWFSEDLLPTLRSEVRTVLI